MPYRHRISGRVIQPPAVRAGTFADSTYSNALPRTIVGPEFDLRAPDTEHSTEK